MVTEYVELTAHVAETAEPPVTGQAFLRDTNLPGFALRITAAGQRSWIVEARVKGQRSAKRRTLGRWPAISADRARRLAIKELALFAQGTDTLTEQRTERARSTTLEAVFEDYLASRDLKPMTVADYRVAFEATFADWSDKRLDSISRDMVERRHKEWGARSRARANLAMRLLRALFNFAVKYEDGEGQPVIIDNPVRRLNAVRSWYRIERRRTVIRQHQLPAWFDGLDVMRSRRGLAPVTADWFEFMLLTGCRSRESRELRWEDVDLAGALFRIPDPKNRELHELPLSDRLKEIIGRLKAGDTGDPRVFFGEGRTGRVSDGRRWVTWLSEQSGVKFCPHDLRRTFATVAESLDIPAYTLKRLLNHTTNSNGDVTAGYVQIDVERLRVPIQRISDTILGAAGRRGTSEVIDINVASAKRKP